ncbi:MAG: LytR C-terminal domain-containing protein [Patescibacteria group bacterium]
MITKKTDQTDNVATEKKSKFTKIFLVSIILLAILGIGSGIYFYQKYQEIKNNPDIVNQKEAETIISALGKMMELPADETPTIATILNKDELKDQPFFNKAENGDKVIAYAKSMQAILYRPSINKIISVAPLVTDQAQTADGVVTDTDTTTEISNELKIVYYNGTESVGLANETETLVKNNYPEYQTLAIKNAIKSDYTKTLVIDLKGDKNQVASDLAQFIGGEVGQLPDGEEFSEADIMIIVGKQD